jgi:hypothetical protein
MPASTGRGAAVRSAGRRYGADPPPGVTTESGSTAAIRARWSLTAEVTATAPRNDAMRLTVAADRSEVEASDLGLSLN